MTRSIMSSRRALALLGAATATTLLLSACGAGQIAETANKAPSIDGVNLQTADNLFKVRNLAVRYLDTKGYPAGGDAPLRVAFYNDSDQPITVRVVSPGARAVELVGGPATAASPTTTGAPGRAGEHTTSATPEVSASATPSDTASAAPGASPDATPTTPSPLPTPVPASGPATINIPPYSYVILDNKSGGSYLRLAGLNAPLAPGQSVEIVFEVDGKRIEAVAPVEVPLTPAPPGKPEQHEGDEGGH